MMKRSYGSLCRGAKATARAAISPSMEISTRMMIEYLFEPDSGFHGKFELSPPSLDRDLEGGDGGDEELPGVLPDGLPGAGREFLPIHGEPELVQSDQGHVKVLTDIGMAEAE